MWEKKDGKSAKLLAVLMIVILAALACDPLAGDQSPQEAAGATVGDWTWLDADGDGIQDGAEVGLANVGVSLEGTDHEYEDSTRSDDEGRFSFEDVPPGEYVLTFSPPEGYQFSPRDVGDDDAVDSDPDPGTGETAPFTVDAGDTASNWDAGFAMEAEPTAVPPPPEPTPTPTPAILIPGGEYELRGSFTNGSGDCMANPTDFQVPLLILRVDGNDATLSQDDIHENEGSLDQSTGMLNVASGEGPGTEGYIDVELGKDLAGSGQYRYTTASGTCLYDVTLEPVE